MALVAVSVAAVGGFAAVPAGATAKAKVAVVNYEYLPSTVKVRKGSKVTWSFKEGTHNVTGKGWKSRTKSGGTYSHVFDKVGFYKYRCTLHQPDMDGIVKVVR